MTPSVSLSQAIDYAILEFKLLKPLIPTYTHLVLSTLFALYIGSHGSLSRPRSAAKPTKKQHHEGEEGDDNEDEDEDEESKTSVQKMGGLEPSDAIMFPIMSGLTLSGLYLLLKNFDPVYLNKVLNWYFSHASFLFTITFIKDGFSVLRSAIFPSRYYHKDILWKVNRSKRTFEAKSSGKASSKKSPETRLSPLPSVFGTVSLPSAVVSQLWRLREASYRKYTLHAYIRSVVDVKTKFTVLDVVAVFLAAVVVVVSVFFPKPWWLTNFFGFSLCYGALQYMSPTTFWTGTLILSSLFFYDIYFVFFTPMMVTVAQKLDLPIKLLFPRPHVPGKTSALAMLGLGDIVVPGTVIGLALRFDLFLHYRNLQTTSDASGENRVPYVSAVGGWGERLWNRKFREPKFPKEEQSYYVSKAFPKTYFKAGIYGYIAGILATLLSMQLSKHAQPALLFLVPGVLVSLWGAAFLNGDLPAMWAFTDEDEDEEEDDYKKSEKTAEEPSQSIWNNILAKIIGSKSESAKSDSKKGKDEDSSDEKKDDNKTPELFLLSISLPEGRSKESHSDEGIPESPLTPEIDNTPISEEQEREPPVKKRRGRGKKA